MEITNEIKAKVFAQYLGQSWKWDMRGTPILKLYASDIVEIDRFNWGQNVKLILKPLSSITDIDFIELSKVCGYVIGKVNRNDHNIWGDYINNDGIHTGTFLISTEKPLYKGKITTIPSNHNPKQDIYTNHALKGFQYLQSKGYDLPQFLLGGKTLQEAGLAIYEK